jgi:hypothetical protein
MGESMKVFVYFNLHKRVFSVKALEGSEKGRVIGHRTSLAIYSPTFKVSEAGRQRVVRERRKNVHAGVVGFLTAPYDWTKELVEWTPVLYNPYVFSSFVTMLGKPVYKSQFARMNIVNGIPYVEAGNAEPC